MSGTFWTIEQIEPLIKERNALRQRVKQLEDEIEKQRDYWTGWNGRAANRNAELEAKLEERGERMRAMLMELRRLTGMGVEDIYPDWFDETGEPL